MSGNILGQVLVVLSVAIAVWLQVRQRNRYERARNPDAGLSVRLESLLGVFLPLVALLAALQEYVEERWDGTLVLAGAAALALVVGLLSLREGPGRRNRGPRRK